MRTFSIASELLREVITPAPCPTVAVQPNLCAADPRLKLDAQPHERENDFARDAASPVRERD